MSRIQHIQSNGGSWDFEYSYNDDGDPIISSGSNPVYKWSRCYSSDGHYKQQNYSVPPGTSISMLESRGVYDNNNNAVEELSYLWDTSEHPNGYYDILRVSEITTERDGEKITTNYLYDNNENLFNPVIIATDGVNKHFEYDSNDSNRVTREYIEDSKYGNLNEIGREYDDYMHYVKEVTLIRSQPGNTYNLTKEYGYYYNGNLESVKEPNGLITTYTYDDLKENSLALSSLGGVRATKVTKKYNGMELPQFTQYIGYSDIGLGKIKYQFDVNGQNYGLYREYVYDSIGNPIEEYSFYEKREEDSPVNYPTKKLEYNYYVLTSRDYDISFSSLRNGSTYFADVKKEIKDSGQIESEYKQTLSESVITRYDYDSNGNLAKLYSTVDLEGDTPYTEYSYDIIGKVTAIKHFDNEETTPITMSTIRYSELYNKEISDANGNITSKYYDQYGRIKEIADPLVGGHQN